jgi:thiol-disulfide isomerase/thioredoxin
MKTFLTVLVIIGFFMAGPAARAQGKMDLASMVIKDSTGAVLSQESWQGLLASGKYSIRIASDGKSGVLFLLTEEQQKLIAAGMAGKATERFFKTGERIASFNEKDMDGEWFNLKELVGKVVVINFWFINCSPCRQEIPDLNELVASYKTNPEVVFIGIALDEKPQLAEFLKTTPFNYHIIPNGRFTAQKYGITGYPTHVVLDKQGKVAFHTTGLSSRTVNGVRSSIEAALKGGSTQ